ncbi:WD40 domain-containing protein [Histoplasma ohiense]|nr:WD40 domain-containing protein [Histoplasma ohiense (nom. inval.)]
MLRSMNPHRIEVGRSLLVEIVAGALELPLAIPALDAMQMQTPITSIVCPSSRRSRAVLILISIPKCIPRENLALIFLIEVKIQRMPWREWILYNYFLLLPQITFQASQTSALSSLSPHFRLASVPLLRVL